LTVDFTTKVDGKPIEGGDVQNYQLQLGSGGLIEGFEAGLNGAETGELRTLSVTLPQSYAQAEFAGKAAVFEVSVREVAEPVLPEVNEEFVRQFGIADGGVQRLRSQVRANLEREMAQRLRALARTRVLEALVDANSFELPQTLLKAETEYVRRMHRALRAQGGADRKETREESIAYEQAAQRRLARSLVLAEVIRSKGIKADPQKVRTRVIELAQGYESPEEFVRACYATPARLAEVEAALLEEQAIDQLLETAQVSEKPLTFQELVKAAAG
jgi:trigger factor